MWLDWAGVCVCGCLCACLTWVRLPLSPDTLPGRVSLFPQSPASDQDEPGWQTQGSQAHIIKPPNPVSVPFLWGLSPKGQAAAAALKEHSFWEGERLSGFMGLAGM